MYTIYICTSRCVGIRFNTIGELQSFSQRTPDQIIVLIIYLLDYVTLKHVSRLDVTSSISRNETGQCKVANSLPSLKRDLSERFILMSTILEWVNVSRRAIVSAVLVIPTPKAA